MTLNTRPSAALGTVLVIVLLTLAALPWASRPALAATINVTTTSDSGAGSLRQALLDANASAVADTITFAASTNIGAIILLSPLPTIVSAGGALTITGNGSANTTVSGNSRGIVFSVAAGARAAISGMTIINGTGANGGAISNAGTLSLAGTIIRNNAAAGNGGAISNSGALTVIGSTVRANSSTNGGGIYNNGGTLALINSVVVGNQATVGGGMFSFGTTVTLSNSTFSLNAAATGGGLFSNTATVTINNSVIANSTSGGGDCVRFQGSVSVRNSLIEDGTCGIATGVNGNLTGDPALNPDLTPAAASRTVDVGLNSLIPAGVTTDLAGSARIQGARVDMGAYEFGGAAAPTSTATATRTATSTATRTATSTATPTVTSTPALAPNSLVLPMIVRSLALPDLVVDQLSLEPATASYRAGDPVLVTVRVTNIGDAPAGGFWVDLYLNPSAPPDAANQRWNERCGLLPCYGIAWPVAGLAPGASIVLTSRSFDPGQSIWTGSFAPGTTTIYAYADSFNAGVAAGAVAERDETNNRRALTGLRVTGSALRVAPVERVIELPPRRMP